MRVSWWVVIVVLAALAVSARAEPSEGRFEAWARPAGPPATQDEQDAPAPEWRSVVRGGAEEGGGPRFGIGVSSPLGWLNRSFGASAYVGVGGKHALQATFGRFNADEIVPGLIAALRARDRYGRTGSILDLGLGWVWYSRRTFEGLMLEAGVLRRERDVHVHPDASEEDTTRSVTYAGRATIGWSWLFGRRVFLAVAVGASAGKETGQLTHDRELAMSTAEPVDRMRIDAELYMRLGFAFGR